MAPFLPGDDNIRNKVAKEITMATTALKMCKDGEPASPPEDPHLQLFQHILTLITTGEFWKEKVKGERKSDVDAAIVNAVTGRIDSGRIVSVVFTHNAVRLTGKPGGTLEQIRVKNKGKVLLDGWETMQDNVEIGVHLQDVVDIIHYLLGGNHVPRDISAALLFVHRRAFPKLASRVKKAARLWGGAPFRVILQYYKIPHKSPIKLKGSLFPVCDPEGYLHRSLDVACLPYDSSSSSSIDGVRHYIVHRENVVEWVEFIDSTYGEIEKIVERNTVDGGMAVRPLSVADAKDLVRTINVLHIFFETKVLMTAIFSMEGLRSHLESRFVVAAASSKLPRPADSQSSTSNATDEADEDEENEDVDARGDIPILRYCRTITGWIDAIVAVADQMARLPNDMELQVYRVNTFPAAPALHSSDVKNFRDRYLETLTSASQEEAARANTFVSERLSIKSDEKFCGRASKALVHAEATAMGLICISALGGQSFGEFTKEWVDKALPTSGEMAIAVSKKCCRSCSILVDHLNARLLTASKSGEFVLPGTHATFFPWCPPLGVPLDILQEMRDHLYDVFDFQARNYGSVTSTTKSSPSVSHVSLPVAYPLFR